MRPVALTTDGSDWRTWANFSGAAIGFQGGDKAWRGRRNKVKALREALRGGPEAVKHFLAGKSCLRFTPIKRRKRPAGS